MSAMSITDVPLFAGLSDTAKVRLRSTSELREYAAGDVILVPGEFAAFFYAIATGAVSVRPTSGPSELAIVLGPGEVFGEMSLLTSAPISAAVIAERKSACLYDRRCNIRSAIRGRTHFS